jgi:hypothetical protein
VLSNTNGLLSLNEESSSLLGTFSLPNPQNSNSRLFEASSIYNQCIYSTLFSAPDSMDAYLKSKRTKLVKPRHNLCLLGLPHHFVDQLKTERASFDGGLLQRILIAAPEPTFFDAQTIRSASKSKISLASIFYAIRKTHVATRKFKFSNDAEQFADKIFNKYRILMQRAYNVDLFLL